LEIVGDSGVEMGGEFGVEIAVVGGAMEESGESMEKLAEIHECASKERAS
jgi:hypothetical protein